MELNNNHYVSFVLGGLAFEYDEEHSEDEERFDTIGDLSAGNLELKNTEGEMTIGNVGNLLQGEDDVLFVVYTERVYAMENNIKTEVIRLISARYATSFERGLYYGKC